MEAKPLVPAAQYVRMSTEDQPIFHCQSTSSDPDIRKEPWLCGGITYADAGKSGIEIKHRKELRRLLADVMNGRAQYKAILCLRREPLGPLSRC